MSRIFTVLGSAKFMEVALCDNYDETLQTRSGFVFHLNGIIIPDSMEDKWIRLR